MDVEESPIWRHVVMLSQPRITGMGIVEARVDLGMTPRSQISENYVKNT